MQTLTSLPDDVLGVIGEHASLAGGKQLRLTCRDFSAIFAPCVLKSLKIQLTTKNYECQLSMLRILASGKSCATYVTKKLDIESLSPRQPLYHHYPTSELPTEEGILAVEAEAKEYFRKALSSLRKVESLCWAQSSHSETIERWVYGEVSAFLRTCSSLRSLTFDASTEQRTNVATDNPVPPLPFETMGQLTRIELSGITDKYGTPNFEHLARHITLYKDLNYISLQDHKLHNEPPDFLSNLFLSYPDSNPPLRLTDIHLWSTVPVIAPMLLRHLRNLTSLTLRGRHHFGPDPLRRSIDLNNFYIVLKEAGIQLHKINITDAPTELFSYLEGYSGLKALEIDIYDFFDDTSGDNKELADAAGRRFFQAIKGHESSLECLHVSYKQKGEWAFNADNAAIWAKMKRLRSARVVVVGTTYNIWDQLIVGDMPLLMDTFVSLPSLQLLEIECEEGQEMGYNLMDYAPEMYNGVRAYIRFFKHPITKAKPCSIKFSKKTIEPVPNPEGSSWIYSGDTLGEEFDLETYSDDEEEDFNEDWEEDWDPEDALDEEEAYDSNGDYDEAEDL